MVGWSYLLVNLIQPKCQLSHLLRNRKNEHLKSYEFLISKQKVKIKKSFRFLQWRRDRPPTPAFLGFPCSSAGKESACNAGNLGFIPGLGRSPGEGKGYLPTPVFWPGEFHWVTKSQIPLSDFHFHFQIFKFSGYNYLPATGILELLIPAWKASG